MNEPIRKTPQTNPESYKPETPMFLNKMEDLCSGKVIETIVIKGVEFQIIEKGRTLNAGAYADEPDLTSMPDDIVYKGEVGIFLNST